MCDPEQGGMEPTNSTVDNTTLPASAHTHPTRRQSCPKGTVRTRVGTVKYHPDSSVTRAPSDSEGAPRRLVAVRYFLDRPGYGLHDSAVRLWFDPPSVCTPSDLATFLDDQGIALLDVLTEVYLDIFQSFMLLEACQAAAIEWNFADTTTASPGIINLRLTDVSYAARLDENLSQGTGAGTRPALSNNDAELKEADVGHPRGTPKCEKHPHANSTPVGLFSFSMMVGLETAAVMGRLAPDSVGESFVLAWGPYMFFVGGTLQIITGVLQVLRNNIYGAVAFLGFGSFWFANGTKQILETYLVTPQVAAYDLIEESDPWGSLIRSLYILMFAMTLWKQTLVMSRLSTTLISFLCCKIVCQAVSSWSNTMAWTQVCFGWLTSLFAFYVFLVEFTNQVYHKEIFKTYKWSEKHSPDEIFGAAGKEQTLYSKATLLRQARFANVHSAMLRKNSH